MAEAIDDPLGEPAAYIVVLNDEGQYAVWPADRQPPRGWQRTPASGSREACLEYVKEVWTDMRPRTLRVRMAGPGAPPA